MLPIAKGQSHKERRGEMGCRAPGHGSRAQPRLGVRLGVGHQALQIRKRGLREGCLGPGLRWLQPTTPGPTATALPQGAWTC